MFIPRCHCGELDPPSAIDEVAPTAAIDDIVDIEVLFSYGGRRDGDKSGNKREE
jgi:hypothetical protein